MNRIGAAIGLRKGMAPTYRRLHQHVWPEVEDAMRAVSFTNFSIFMGEETLFRYFEYGGDDLSADQAALASLPIVRRWWDLTAPCQQPLNDAVGPSGWTVLENAYHLG